MRILLLTQNYFPSTGGGIRYKLAFVRIMREIGHTVDILCTNTENKLSIEKENNGKIIRTPQFKRLGSTAISFSTFNWFKKIANEYDLLHFNFPSPFTDMALVHSRHLLHPDVKLTCYYHADIVPSKFGSFFYNNLYTKRFLKYLDIILVSNPKIYENSTHLSKYKHKIKICPFGIDAGNHFGLNDEQIKKLEIASRSCENKKLNVLFVGRLSRYKGVDLLLKACSNLNVRLNILGEGPLERSLKDNAKKISCEVKFHGYVKDENLPYFYAEADVFVLPSIDEGEAFGYVLLEAMRFDCAVISTEVGTGTSWINQHKITGLVCKPNDVLDLRNAINSFLINDDFLSDCKKNSRLRFDKNFTLNTMKEKLIEYLDIK